MVIQNEESYQHPDITAPARGAVAITPGASPIFPAPRALYIGVTGDLEVVMLNGNVITFTNVPVGWFPISVSKVTSGTTADGIIGLY